MALLSYWQVVASGLAPGAVDEQVTNIGLNV